MSRYIHGVPLLVLVYSNEMDMKIPHNSLQFPGHVEVGDAEKMQDNWDLSYNDISIYLRIR